jgi:hypothetical protein
MEKYFEHMVEAADLNDGKVVFPHTMASFANADGRAENVSGGGDVVAFLPLARKSEPQQEVKVEITRTHFFKMNADMLAYASPEAVKIYDDSTRRDFQKTTLKGHIKKP